MREIILLTICSLMALCICASMIMSMLEKGRRVVYKYQWGDLVQSRISTGSGAIPVRYRVWNRKAIKGRPAYLLERLKPGCNWFFEQRGRFDECDIEPYGPTPIPHPGESDA